jgi:Ni/Co efflux regulator RcnB
VGVNGTLGACVKEGGEAHECRDSSDYSYSPPRNAKTLDGKCERDDDARPDDYRRKHINRPDHGERWNNARDEERE